MVFCSKIFNWTKRERDKNGIKSQKRENRAAQKPVNTGFCESNGQIILKNLYKTLDKSWKWW